jgi:predicted phage replisome organizer
MPDGNTIALIWAFLLAQAGESNKDGALYFTEEIPYSPEEFALQYDFEADTVKLAVTTFERFGMIEIFEGIIYIKNWEEYQNAGGLEKIREQNRIRQANYRQKLLDNAKSNVTVTEEITLHNGTDIDIEIEEDKEIKKKKKPLKDKNIVYFPNDEKLNQTFLDFIQMRKSLKNGTMTERAISMMITKLSKFDNDTAIQLLEKSITNNWKDIYMPEVKKDFQSVIKEWGND